MPRGSSDSPPWAAERKLLDTYRERYERELAEATKKKDKRRVVAELRSIDEQIEALTPTDKPAWRDEHPDRYGPIEHVGDYCVITVPGNGHHFVEIWGPGIGGLRIADTTACGYELPDYATADMSSAEREEKERLRLTMPMGGVVDCPACLAAMEEAQR